MFKLKMAGKQKKSLKKLVFAGIIILGLVGCAKETRATFVDSNCVEEGLEYYIRIDKGVYDLGEAIEMLCRVNNVGGESLNLAELSFGFTAHFQLETPTGDILFAAYNGVPMPPCIPNIVTLNPGDYMEVRGDITSLTWGVGGEIVEEPFSTVGQYSFTSDYDNNWPGAEGPLSLVPHALDFVIIPEPASIVLLGLGLASLLMRRKGKGKCSS